MTLSNDMLQVRRPHKAITFYLCGASLELVPLFSYMAL